MKILTLNTWGGILYEPLIEFLKKQKENIDIFFFQEMLFGEKEDFTPVDKGRINLFMEISKALNDFEPYKYLPGADYFQHEPINFDAGQAVFVRKGTKVSDTGGFHCYDELPQETTEGGKLTGSAQWIDIEVDNKKLTVVNLHGLWQKNTKKVDTPARLVQSQKIKDFLKNKEGEKIICGDFNLIPNGRSIEILEEGMVNLIKKHKVTGTRSGVYTGQERFADYILISPGVRDIEFQVMQNEVSDHLPLFMEFEIN